MLEEQKNSERTIIPFRIWSTHNFKQKFKKWSKTYRSSNQKGLNKLLGETIFPVNIKQMNNMSSMERQVNAWKTIRKETVVLWLKAKKGFKKLLGKLIFPINFFLPVSAPDRTSSWFLKNWWIRKETVILLSTLQFKKHF